MEKKYKVERVSADSKTQLIDKLTSSNYKKLSPNKYYTEYAIFKLDENNNRIYEEVFYSKIIALHLKCFM